MSYSFIDDPIEDSHDEGIGAKTARNTARQISNIGTRAVGLPGDILSLVNDFIAKPASEAISGKKGTPYEQTFLGKAIPTTETHRKGVENVAGDYLKPRNEIERWGDDVIEDAAMILNPTQLIKGGAKLLNKSAKSLFKSIGANLAGESTKQISGSDEAGALTKAGSIFMLSLLDQEGAAKQIAKLYNQAEQNLPSGATTSAKKLQTNLNGLKKSVTKGRPAKNLAPSEKFVVDAVNKVENLIQNGKIKVDQSWAQKKSLNEDLQKLYEITPNKKDQIRARGLAKQINGMLNETIHDYGKTNPKFLKPYKDADQAFGTIAKSNIMARWAEKNIKQSPMTSGLIHLVLGPLGIGAATAFGGLYAPYQAGKLSYRIAQSPTLAKIYGNTVKAAAKEDSVLFNKYLKQLDDAMQKEEGEEYWEFQD